MASRSAWHSRAISAGPVLATATSGALHRVQLDVDRVQVGRGDDVLIGGLPDHHHRRLGVAGIVGHPQHAIREALSDRRDVELFLDLYDDREVAGPRDDVDTLLGLM